MTLPHLAEIDPKEFARLEKLSAEYSKIEGSCYLSHIIADADEEIDRLIARPYRVQGIVLVFLLKGQLSITLNTDTITVNEPAIVSLHHGQELRLEPNTHRQLDAYTLIYTPSFLHDINISFSVVSPEAFTGHDHPVLSLADGEMEQMLRFVSLIHSSMVFSDNNQLNRHIVSSLTSAMIYQLMLLAYKRIEKPAGGGNVSRRINYVHDFMHLVQVYYTSERAVAFYASRLFISPKYLSMLVKQATGRSAAQWIDHFVVNEAKNLLRFSGKNVQQVAYALNFSNQSSFGKYFKHITGMSPTEYQKQ